MAISCLFPYFATFIIKVLDLIFDMVCPIAGFPGNSAGKESACNAGDPGLIPGSGRSPGGRHGNPLQCSCLENPHGQRSLAGYILYGRKGSDMTKVT